MPVKDHNHLLSRQFLLQTYRPEHVNNAINFLPPPQRNIRKRLGSKFHHEIEHVLPQNQTVDTATYKRGMKILHTTAVNNTITSYQNNRVADDTPPAICHSYRSRINSDIPDSYSDCNESPHSTLFTSIQLPESPNQPHRPQSLDRSCCCGGLPGAGNRRSLIRRYNNNTSFD